MRRDSMKNLRVGLVSFCLSLSLSCTALQAAEAPETPLPAKPWNPSIPAPASDDLTGFTALFDGKSLQNWKGDPAHWRVENGEIIGEANAENPLKAHSYLVWQGGRVADFEIRLDYKINSTGNSGFVYRADQDPAYKWGLRGYQFDIDGAAWGQQFHDGKGKEKGWDLSRSSGSNYSEDKVGERTWIALPGEMTHATTGGHQQVTGTLGDPKDMTAAIHEEDWNTLRVIVRGNTMTHILNGRVISIVVDDDMVNRRMDGLISVQVHRGPPLKVEFKNIYLKKLGK